MPGARVDFTFDLESFKDNAEALAKALDAELEPVLKEMTSSFVNIAATRTPPDIGRRTISKKKYVRELVDLKKEADLSEIDKVQLAQGRRWKVIYDRKGNLLRKKHGGRSLLQEQS